MKFLPVSAVEALHRASIDIYGGSHGLRDRGLLESAVARAENTAHYTADATVGSVAASLAWGLIKNHAFIDGNKRVGLAALIAMLKLNQLQLNCLDVEATEMVLRAAAGTIKEAEWIAWVVAVVRPVL